MGEGREYTKRKITGLLSFCIMLYVCMLLPVCVHADTEEARTIRVAFPVQEGMSYFREDGTPDGYNYTYLEKIAEYTGWKMEYVPYDTKDLNKNVEDAIQDLQDGKVDLLGPMLSAASSIDGLILTEQNYGTVYTTLCALEGSNLREENASSVSPLRIGLWKQAQTRNSEVLLYLATENFDYKLFYYDTAEEQYQALEDGSVDVISNVSLSPIEGTRIIERFSPRPYYFASSSENAELLQELNEAMETVAEVQPSLQEVLFDRFFRNTRYVFSPTETQRHFIESLGTLHVLCMDHDAPYVYRREGEPAGMLVRILDEFAEETGLTIEYTFCEEKEEAEEKLQEEHFDMMVGLNFTSAYCAQIGFVRSKSIMESNLAYLHKGNNTDQKRVAVESGLENLVDTTDFEETIICDNALDCVTFVDQGLADYGIGDRSSLEYYTYDTYRTLSTSLISGSTQTVCIAVARDSDLQLIRLLNDYIYSLTDVQKTTFLEDGNAHIHNFSLYGYVRLHPVQTLFLGILLASIVAVAFSMLYHARKMRKKNQELLLATEAKSDFLTRMSHDIRTPMNGIIGLLDISDQFVDDPQTTLKYHGKIREASNYLLSLINDVLDMSKLDSEAVILTEDSVSLQELLENCNGILENKAAENGILLCTDGIRDFMPPRVFTSELHLRQVIMNIVSNSIKYNKPNGRILTSAEVTEQTEEKVTCRFVVEDTGIGMSEEFQKHMFEPFSQEHGKARSEFKGTGLGLSIVKEIIDKMGGQILVESQKDVGTKFTWILTFRIDTQYEPAKEQVPNAHVSLEGKHILAAEDNTLNTEILQFMLKELGADVVFVENGKKAVEAFAASKPGTYDCILMDIMMPVMDGYTASKAIRSMKREDALGVPIIALTANAFAEDVQKSEEAGMNAHITKPVDAEKLKECMTRLMGNTADRKLN